MPAASNARSRSLPDGPTNGRPALSSASPGCSPTTITWAVPVPSPNTVWVPSLKRSHPWQPFAAARSFASVGRGGMKSAAEPVGFAVLFGFIVLLAVLIETVVSGDRPISVVGLSRALSSLALGLRALQVLDERCVGLVSVPALDVGLVVLLVVLRHRCPPGVKRN